MNLLTWHANTLALASVTKETTLFLDSLRTEPAFLHLTIRCRQKTDPLLTIGETHFLISLHCKYRNVCYVTEEILLLLTLHQDLPLHLPQEEI